MLIYKEQADYLSQLNQVLIKLQKDAPPPNILNIILSMLEGKFNCRFCQWTEIRKYDYLDMNYLYCKEYQRECAYNTDYFCYAWKLKEELNDSSTAL